MFPTLIIILFLLVVAAAGGYYAWCLRVQRDQAPGRHRTTDQTAA